MCTFLIASVTALLLCQGLVNFHNTVMNTAGGGIVACSQCKALQHLVGIKVTHCENSD